MEKEFKSLRIFNGILGFIHFTLATFFLAYYETNKSKFIPPSGDLDFVRYTLYRNKIAVNPNDFKVTYVNEDTITINVIYLIVGFHLVTSIFHLLYAANVNKFYINGLRNNRNDFRWLEYSITATTMIVILGLSSFLLNADELLLIAAMTVGVMLTGFFVESNIGKASNTSLWVATFVAWVLMIVAFAIIITAFVYAIQAANDAINSSSSENTLIPTWVYALIATEVVLFMSFGIVQFAQLAVFTKTKRNTFIKCEWSYHALSAVAKVLLGTMIFFGTMQR
jgi:hypothetical protein